MRLSRLEVPHLPPWQQDPAAACRCPGSLPARLQDCPCFLSQPCKAACLSVSEQRPTDTRPPSPMLLVSVGAETSSRYLAPNRQCFSRCLLLLHFVPPQTGFLTVCKRNGGAGKPPTDAFPADGLANLAGRAGSLIAACLYSSAIVPQRTPLMWAGIASGAIRLPSSPSSKQATLSEAHPPVSHPRSRPHRSTESLIIICGRSISKDSCWGSFRTPVCGVPFAEPLKVQQARPLLLLQDDCHACCGSRSWQHRVSL